MFKLLKAKLFGYETYGKIVSIRDPSFRYLEFAGSVRPTLPEKVICVKYQINGEIYYLTQRIYNVLSEHERILQVGKYIRIKVCESDPKVAYINEFDYPEYKL